jgi:hypothetical protein
MAENAPPRIIEPAIAPQHYERPTARALRSQSVHRLQVGLFGLAAMLLLVGLANIIMERAQLTEAAHDPIEEVIAADAVPKKPASDPLADIGVVPSADPNREQAPPAKKTPPAAEEPLTAE